MGLEIERIIIPQWLIDYHEFDQIERKLQISIKYMQVEFGSAYLSMLEKPQKVETV